MLDMPTKLAKALKLGGDLFDVRDIMQAIAEGRMQGHVIGDTWAVTQVQNWPKVRAVEILLIVGNLDESITAITKIEHWAKSIGATRVMSVGRDGWWKFKTPGWQKVGVLYSKDV